MKVEALLIVKNEKGLHARPAGQIAKLARLFTSKLSFSLGPSCIDAKQVMNLLLLQAHQNAQIQAVAEGEDAFELIEELKLLFSEEFGEKSACH